MKKRLFQAALAMSALQIAFAQGDKPRAKLDANANLPLPPAGLPRSLYQCDVTPTGNNCGVWRWSGQAYEGFWQNGAIARLTIESGSASALVIRRQDPAGVAAGLSATYNGQWDGKRIAGGKVSWASRGYAATYEWTASSEYVPGSLPVAISRECRVGGDCAYFATNLYPSPLSAFGMAAANLPPGIQAGYVDYRLLRQPLQQAGEKRYTGLGGRQVQFAGQLIAVAALFEDGEAWGSPKAIADLRAKRKEQLRTLDAMSERISALAGKGLAAAQIASAFEANPLEFAQEKPEERYVTRGGVEGYHFVLQSLQAAPTLQETQQQIEQIRASLSAEGLEEKKIRAFLPETASTSESAQAASPIELPSAPDGTAANNVGIKVSAAVAEKLLRVRVDPVYAPLMRQARIQGTVNLEFTVTPTGDVTFVKVLGSPNELLKGAATDAVAQWKYNPYLVNGRPTAMRTTADVKFQLSQ